MKAAVYTRYGPPDVVQIMDVERPVPKDNQVLIRVRAASVNPLDCGIPKGAARIMTGLSRPKLTRLGVDVAGHVETVGRNATEFKPGDEVFGACIAYPRAAGIKAWIPQGAFGDFVCAPESVLVMKPENVTFEQAASAPVAAFTALQGLRDKGHIQPGQKVLINGAAGGVGTFAVQLAKSLGASVTGVCSTRNVEMVRSIGADQVIDYTREDFTKNEQRYDLVLDCVWNHSLSESRRVLSPNGTYIIVGGPASRWMIGLLARMIKALVLSRFMRQKLVPLPVRRSQADLATMHDLLKAGKVTPVIDRCFSLNEAAEAIRYLEEGHARGKVVIVPEKSFSS